MKIASKLLLALLAVSGAAFADDAAPADSLAYNVGVVSQYRYRGIAQTRGEPALQGGADFAAASGWYVGTWASTITWISDDARAPSAPAGASAKGPVEWDLYGGYKFSAGPVGMDVGFLRYEYAGNNLNGFVNPNTNEVYAAATVDVFTLKYSYALSDLFGAPNSAGAQYFDLSGTFDLGEGYSVVPHVGRQTFGNQNGVNNSAYQYTDYALTLNKDLGAGLSASAALIGTNAQAGSYTNNGSNYNQGKSTLVVGVKYTF